MRSILILILVTFLTGCTATLDKPINTKDFDEVIETINSDANYSEMKKKYIIDNLTMQIGLAKVGEAMNIDESKLPTFREQIAGLGTDFDSTRIVVLDKIDNNMKIENFVMLKDANTTSIDKYKGYLSMTLDFDNQFDKEILYIVINYKYINNYDSEFFSKKSKLTDEVAGNFKEEIVISTKEEYNNVSDFMYTKVPVQASKKERDELGVKVANEKVKHDFLMEGLKVKTLLIVFKDKSELTFQNADWEYLED